MGRRGFGEEEAREPRRGILPRVRGLLEEGWDLHVAWLAYYLFSRLESGGGVGFTVSR